MEVLDHSYTFIPSNMYLSFFVASGLLEVRSCLYSAYSFTLYFLARVILFLFVAFKSLIHLNTFLFIKYTKENLGFTFILFQLYNQICQNYTKDYIFYPMELTFVLYESLLITDLSVLIFCPVPLTDKLVYTNFMLFKEKKKNQLGEEE